MQNLNRKRIIGCNSSGLTPHKLSSSNLMSYPSLARIAQWVRGSSLTTPAQEIVFSEILTQCHVQMCKCQYVSKDNKLTRQLHLSSFALMAILHSTKPGSIKLEFLYLQKKELHLFTFFCQFSEHFFEYKYV